MARAIGNMQQARPKSRDYSYTNPSRRARSRPRRAGTIAENTVPGGDAEPPRAARASLRRADRTFRARARADRTCSRGRTKQTENKVDLARERDMGSARVRVRDAAPTLPLSVVPFLVISSRLTGRAHLCGGASEPIAQRVLVTGNSCIHALPAGETLILFLALVFVFFFLVRCFVFLAEMYRSFDIRARMRSGVDRKLRQRFLCSYRR